MLTRSEAAAFARQLGKEVTRCLSNYATKKYKPPKVTYKLHRVSQCGGRFTYSEISDGVIRGRIVVVRGPDGNPKIAHSWCVTPFEARNHKDQRHVVKTIA